MYVLLSLAQWNPSYKPPTHLCCYSLTKVPEEVDPLMRGMEGTYTNIDFGSAVQQQPVAGGACKISHIEPTDQTMYM